MHISSSAEAGVLVKSLRTMRGISRKELASSSGIPLRTVYAVENGEINNLSLDRLITLLNALEAQLCIRTENSGSAATDKTNKLINQAARGAAETSDAWGIWS